MDRKVYEIPSNCSRGNSYFFKKNIKIFKETEVEQVLLQNFRLLEKKTSSILYFTFTTIKILHWSFEY